MYTSSWVKRKCFHRKIESQMFLFISGRHIDVHQWCLHTKLLKVAWNVQANNSEMVYHTDLRLQEVLYVLVFYIMSFSWLLSLNGFKFIFLWCDSESDLFIVHLTRRKNRPLSYAHFLSALKMLCKNLLIQKRSLHLQWWIQDFWKGGGWPDRMISEQPRQNRLSESFVPFLNFKLKRPQRGGWRATQSTPLDLLLTSPPLIYPWKYPPSPRLSIESFFTLGILSELLGNVLLRIVGGDATQFSKPWALWP